MQKKHSARSSLNECCAPHEAIQSVQIESTTTGEGTFYRQELQTRN